MDCTAGKGDMKGAVALVTGAGSGMGRELVHVLAERGVTVAVVDIRAEAAAQTIEGLAELRNQARAYALDVSDSTAVANVVAAVERDLGPIAHLANLAGIHDFRAIEDITDLMWDRMMRVNVYGQFYTCRAVLSGMVARRAGTIVNMSSIHAVRGEARGAHYAREKAPFNVRANSVAPGPIDTPLWRGDRSDEVNAAIMQKRSQVIPIGRLGQAREVAEVIAFLLSPQSSYVTGQTFNIDGGEVMN